MRDVPQKEPETGRDAGLVVLSQLPEIEGVAEKCPRRVDIRLSSIPLTWLELLDDPDGSDRERAHVLYFHRNGEKAKVSKRKLA